MATVVVPDLGVIDEPRAAAAVLDPIRASVLSVLREPGSATTVAAAIGETRQKVNYHLRSLEELGLVQFVEDRPRRGLTERVVVASARAYVLSPELLGDSAVDPASTDQLSSNYVLALASRVVREVADLARRARAADKPLATLAIDTDIRFASAADRAAFTDELTSAISTLAARYHDEQAPNGRWHRVVALAHQCPSTSSPANRKA
ncbi:MAG: helix-turn-helix domain-containing protein [Ilumatobacter sp.]|uniref:ArsR/SmtB family transcription factor n=1 Tax=Ilumatobacter sp. TaxID=1967498 RepID=UPI003C744157